MGKEIAPWKRTQRESEKRCKELVLVYIFSSFLASNDKLILHHHNIQKRKLKSVLEILLQEVINGSHDPNKAIFNFYLHELKDVEKSVLCKGLNFKVKPK